MSKKKSLPVLILIFILAVAAACFCRAGGVFASAEGETDPTRMVTPVSGTFSYEDGAKTILNGFTAPEVDGYFEVVIPEGVTRIKANTFVGTGTGNEAILNNFIAVQIPASVTAIEEGAFVNCVNLLEVCCLNEGLVNKIGGSGLNGALSVVTKITDKSLGVKLDGTENYLFVRDGNAASTKWSLVAYAGDASTLTLPAASVCAQNCTSYSIYDNAFARKELTSVVVPAHVTKIGNNAFSNCTKLESVTLNKGLEEIGAAAFNATKISSIVIPDTVKVIRESAFNNCTKLVNVNFTGRDSKIDIYHNAFYGCSAMQVISLPDKAEIGQYAFSNCTSLIWVYVGSGSKFTNTEGAANVTFFPANSNLTIVFPDKAAYDTVMNATDKTFANNHGDAARYVVKVNYFVGDTTEAKVFERLNGQNYNYVKNEATGFWGTETAQNGLFVQDNSYASTVWYKEQALTTKADLAEVNKLLQTESEIKLYCYATVKAPTDLPVEPVSWVYDDDKTYDSKNLNQVLTAMGSKTQYGEKELSALTFEVKFADDEGNVKETPDQISGNGVYSVTVKLNEKYGEWLTPAASTVTITVDTGAFTIILIIFAIIGALAIAATVSTAVIRKKVQAKNKKKQLSSQEVLDKFRAVGGETTLK